MAWTKVKIAAVVGVAALLIGGAAITVIKVTTPPDYSWEVQNPSDRTFLDARP